MNGLDGGDLISLDALSNAEWVADLVDRLQRSEQVDFERYIAENPDRGTTLRRILPALQMLTRLADDEDGSANPREVAESIVRVGDYQTIRVLGRGGMGIVYEAVQISLNRRVALKILPTISAADPRRLRRFHIEAQAAACLQHPHIVPVYNVGFDSGIHYFAMQLIDGRTLAELIRGQGADGVDPGANSAFKFALDKTLINFSSDPSIPSPRDDSPGADLDDTGLGRTRTTLLKLKQSSRTRSAFRAMAELGRQAAEALQFAHEQGILHRDVKPSNILIDDSGWLWIADFGLARIPGDAELTASGDMLGTLRYMSPEQVLNPKGVIDHRTDVYSLGATLYEMITRRPAFAEDDRLQLIRRIVEDEPKPPRHIDPAIPRDLETIVLKAMSKDRAERYPTANALAADLLRFVERRAILARPPRLRDRLVKWGWRHQTAAMMMITAVLIGGALLGAAISWRYRLLRQHTREVEFALRLAEKHAQAANEERLKAQHHEWSTRRFLYGSQMRRAQEEASSGRLEFAQEILEGLRSRPGEADARGFEWNYLHRLCHRKLSTLFGHASPVYCMALSPNGKILASGDYDGTLILWDLPNWRQLSNERAHRTSIAGVAFSHDGSSVVSWTSGATSGDQAAFWDVKTGDKRLELPEIEGGIISIAFAPGDSELAMVVGKGGESKGELRFWDLSHGLDAIRLRPGGIAVDAIAYSPDGRWLISATEKGIIEQRDAHTHEIVRTLGPSISSRGKGLRAITFTPDSESILTATAQGITRWEAETGREMTLLPIANAVSIAASRGTNVGEMKQAAGGMSSPDQPGEVRPWHLSNQGSPGNFGFASPSGRGGLLAVRRLDVPLTLWELATGSKADQFPDRLRDRGNVLFDRTERSVFFGGDDGRIRSWHIIERPEPSLALPGHSGEVWGLAYSDDGNTLLSSGDDALIRLWNPRTGKAMGVLRGHDSLVSSVAVARGGQIVASAGFDNTVRLWRLPEGDQIAELKGHEDRIRAVTFSPDGRYVASAGSDNSLRVWEVNSLEQHWIHNRHTQAVRALAFDRSGSLLVSSGDDRTIRVTRLIGGSEVKSIPCPNRHTALSFSPNGKILASGDDRGYITLWDTEKWEQEKSFKGADAEIFGIAYSPDGQTLATGCGDTKVRLCDPSTGLVTLLLSGHSQRVNAVAFSPSGDSLATSDHEGIIRLWLGPKGEESPFE